VERVNLERNKKQKQKADNRATARTKATIGHRACAFIVAHFLFFVFCSVSR
jgi:hypothetical protein